MQRVLVVGSPGAGKSTLSRAIASRCGLPLIMLDGEFWRPKWQPSELTEWRTRVADLASGPAWVMDGNYSGTFALRMPRADTMIWLDLPRAICMRRVLWRTLRRYGRSRPELPGCPERFDATFLRHVWEFPWKHRPRIVEALAAFGGGLQVTRLTDDAAVKDFMLTGCADAAV